MKVSVYQSGFFEEIAANGRRHYFWSLPFLTILILLVGQILGIVPIMEFGLSTPETLEQYPDILYMLFAPFSMLLVVLFLWVKFFERRGLTSLGVSFNQGSKFDLIYGYGTGLGMSASIVLVVLVIGGYQISDNPPLTMVNILPPLLLILGFGLQSTAEEVLFRGWLLSRVMELKGEKWAIAISSVMFTLVHLIGEDFAAINALELILFVVMTLLFSVYLAYETLKRRSIWFAAAWHAGWNWLFINGFGLATTGIALNTRPLILNLDAVETMPVWLTGGVEGPENSIITLIVLLIFCVMARQSYRNNTIAQ